MELLIILLCLSNDRCIIFFSIRERSRYFFKIRRKIATRNRKMYCFKQLLEDKLKNTILEIKTIKIKKKRNKEVTFVQFHSISRLNRIFFTI